jgi:hypothetical protein
MRPSISISGAISRSTHFFSLIFERFSLPLSLYSPVQSSTCRVVFLQSSVITCPISPCPSVSSHGSDCPRRKRATSLCSPPFIGDDHQYGPPICTAYHTIPYHICPRH